jgi:hypothetical protein
MWLPLFGVLSLVVFGCHGLCLDMLSTSLLVGGHLASRRVLQCVKWCLLAYFNVKWCLLTYQMVGISFWTDVRSSAPFRGLSAHGRSTCPNGESLLTASDAIFHPTPPNVIFLGKNPRKSYKKQEKSKKERKER